MYDVAGAAVESALAAGARYADARAIESRSEQLGARNGVVEQIDRAERTGLGVRALIGSSWGFYAVPDPSTAAARRAGERAAAIARSSTMVAGPQIDLAAAAVGQGSWASECREDPWDVSLGEKADLLQAVTRTMLSAGSDIA